MRVCECASVRVCECASVRVCECASVRVCECASVRVCECASVRVCECASVIMSTNRQLIDYHLDMGITPAFAIPSSILYGVLLQNDQHDGAGQSVQLLT